MPRSICAHCEQPATFKLASFYWGWRWPSGDRRAYVQLLCPACAEPEMLKFELSSQHPGQCLVCQDACEYPSQVTVYASVYIPGRDKLEGEQRFCIADFEKEEQMFEQNARRLPDRGLTAGGPPPSTPQQDPWAAIGLHP